MKEFHGIIPPLVTPLTANQQIDVPALERLIEHIIAGGAHGLFILGTTGEGPALGAKLQWDMIRETRRIVGTRVPVLVGVSSAAFADSVSAADYAAQCGCAAVVAAPPCYFSLGDAELYDYYTSLVKESKLPVFIYNMPGMTKSYLKPDLVLKLAQVPGICGYKDSSGNMPDFHQIILALKDRQDFSLFVGPEELLGESVLSGADGGIAGGANLNPRLFVSMYNAALAGNIPEMHALQAKIYQQRRLYGLGRFQSSMIKGLKCALQQKGMCEAWLVAPFNRFDGEYAEHVAEILKELEG